ncbi:RNA-binding protein NOB1 [Pseudolycoriella hygida]|uniref:RNA-binding protein NOB1 n=1 Tax=Pseudolycoriella hygida TaxID=35572 RepID=A0A9Q0S3Y6_9DIPT|nr:RNA-binding protein NOB1 [Pseudolycoriella hygida]
MEKRFHCLIADTTAFIENVALQDYADYVITVPEVINEIKNKRQLKRLCVLPYDLTIDEPSPESVRHVIDFAKKTGDYFSLSSADIKVLALTYQLEKELVGEAHLRTEPVAAKLIASRDKPPELIDNKPLAGFYLPPSKEQLNDKEKLNEGIIDSKELPKDVEKDVEEDDVSSEDDAIDLELKKQIENLRINDEPEKSDEANDVLVQTVEGCDDSETEESSDDDDEDSWITPSNLLAVKSSYGKESAAEESVRVACMSTDYSIQNVLKQINLNIAALDGKIIKQMRTYILRCYACYKTTSIMTKVFCPKCGNKTLKRVAVSLDENGQQVIHINTRRPLTAKGKNTSIPRPRGGKHSSNPILFEDQPMPKQMPSRVARTKTNALDEDYVAGFSPFVRRDVDSKSALLRAKAGGNSMRQWMRNYDFQNTKRKQKK